jgi:beta-fructofuranosidase
LPGPFPSRVKADSELRLEGVAGNSIELEIEIIPGKGATQYGVKVCGSVDGTEQTLVYYDAAEKKLKVDTVKSGPKGKKLVEAGPFALAAGEALKLRVFIDKSVIEVFANDGRQAITRRIYPSAGNAGQVSLFSNGGPATTKAVKA